MQLSVAERATQAHGILRQSGTVPSNLLPPLKSMRAGCVALRLASILTKNRQRRLRRHATRRDHRQYRAAEDRRGPACECRGPAMGRRRVHARVRGADAFGGRAWRPARHTAHVRGRHRAVCARVARLRTRARCHHAGRRARRARHRRGRHAAELAGAAQSVIRPRSEAAGACSRAVDRRGRDFDRGRTGGRRCADRGIRLAQHLSRQSADLRGWFAGDVVWVPRRESRGKTRDARRRLRTRLR